MKELLIAELTTKRLEISRLKEKRAEMRSMIEKLQKDIEYCKDRESTLRTEVFEIKNKLS